MKCGWPLRDTLSFEAITENSDYPNFRDSAKQNRELMEWKGRHKVSDKSVSFYSFECLFLKTNFRSKPSYLEPVLSTSIFYLIMKNHLIFFV